MRHRVLARLWILSSLLIPSVAWSPPRASSLVVVMYDPLYLSVWLISQAIHVEMAAIHQGNPGRATCSLPWLFLNQSSSTFYVTGLYCLLALRFFLWVLSLRFHSSSGFIFLSGWKPQRTCQILKPFGCILCVSLWVPAWWGWSGGHCVTFELTGNAGGMHCHGPFLPSGLDCLSRV